jgi:hypothetical protein
VPLLETLWLNANHGARSFCVHAHSPSSAPMSSVSLLHGALAAPRPAPAPAPATIPRNRSSLKPFRHVSAPPPRHLLRPRPRRRVAVSASAADAPPADARSTPTTKASETVFTLLARNAPGVLQVSRGDALNGSHKETPPTLGKKKRCVRVESSGPFRATPPTDSLTPPLKQLHEYTSERVTRSCASSIFLPPHRAFRLHLVLKTNGPSTRRHH